MPISGVIGTTVVRIASVKNDSKMRSYLKKSFTAKSDREFFCKSVPFHKVEGVIFEIYENYLHQFGYFVKISAAYAFYIFKTIFLALFDD